MAALEDTNYKDMSPDQVARAVAHTTKASDVLFCLVEFARGKPDSRPGPGYGMAARAQRQAAAHSVALARGARAADKSDVDGLPTGAMRA